MMPVIPTATAAGGRESMKNRITGRSAFLALLKDEGVTHLFGNPGTTELPIMHALKDHPDLTYVMAMQESLVVAMADGFSRASGKLVACNVHVAPGLGNVARQQIGANVAAGVNMLGEQTTLEGKRAVGLPLRFDDGVVLLGPVRIGVAPALF